MAPSLFYHPKIQHDAKNPMNGFLEKLKQKFKILKKKIEKQN